MPEIKSVRDADIQGKRVLLHTDFDVPLLNGKVADDARIRAALPTIALLREKGAKQIIIISKLGRPGGKIVEVLRMAPVAARLGELIDLAGIEVRENLRFDPREEANDDTFAKELSALGDIFVNEAFADSHRAHASIVGIPKYLPSYAGLHFLDEITHLEVALHPPHQSIAIIGGAKFETKEPLLLKLVSLYDSLVLGGALANDVLKSRGFPVGGSTVSAMPVPTPLAMDERVQLPSDLVVIETGGDAERSCLVTDIRASEQAVDIGESTAKNWAEKIRGAQFILWNGPMGVYEKGFTRATDELAEAVATGSCRAIIGGGDTDAALAKFSFDKNRIFISTGGGAMLQFLADGTLPGIEALRN
jgi:phosphoglycerate kinase